MPTLATYAALADEGLEHGMPADQHAKVFEVLDAGLGALELAHRAGCRSCTGPTCSAGCTAASSPSSPSVRGAAARRHPPLGDHGGGRLVGLEGRAGVVAPGAFADLLVVDGNPLERLEVLTDPARHLRLVMAAGRIHTNSLA